MKTAAIVPMRGDSERIKGKNYRDFAGRPLFHHIVESLLNCQLVQEVYIDTDSSLIIEDAHERFPEVKTLVRPEALRGGSISMNAVLENTLTQIESDLYLQTHSTNPLLRTGTISTAIETLLDDSTHDSLFSVTRLQTRLYDSDGIALNHDPHVLLRTQDLRPVYEENSNLYLFTKPSFLSRKNRVGANPILFEVSPDEAWDIDEETDFIIAELLYKHKEKLP